MRIIRHLKNRFIPLALIVFLSAGCGDSEQSYVFTSSPNVAVVQPVNPGTPANPGGSRGTREGFSADAGVLSPLPTVAPDTSTGPLLAIYMVGSDLESQNNAGTDDFGELITGLRTLSDAQRSSLGLLIAFGGANKDGWRGMKWATADQLIADSRDGVFGNETAPGSYLYRADGANMGHPSSLTQYLTFVRDYYPNKTRRFVDMWDHGASYEGFGNDENFNNRPLSLPEIEQSFQASSFPKVDMIGFDACLMASMETVRYTRTHANYLIASEELEPGHGWDYRYVGPAMVNAPDMVAFGRGLVDNFVNSANHPYASDGKTLSLLDLNVSGAALDAVQAYSVAYASFLDGAAKLQVLNSALDRSERFGQGDNSFSSVDLLGLANATATASGGSLPGAAVQAGVQPMIVYSRDDGSKPGSTGVSIAPPNRIVANVASQLLATEGWFNLVQTVVRFATADTQAPVPVAQQTDSRNVTISYSDSLPVDTSVFHGARRQDGSIAQIAALPAQSDETDGRYSVPEWDGTALTLRDGESGAAYTLPIAYTDDYGEGLTYYVDVDYVDGEADYSDQEQPFDTAYLEIEVDEAGQVTSCDVRPYFFQYDSATDTTGHQVFERDSKPLKAGDSLTLYADSLREGGQQDEGQVTFGAQFRLTAKPVFTQERAVDPLGGTLVYGATGEDFAENIALTLFGSVR